MLIFSALFIPTKAATLLAAESGGAGGSRTLVQTPHRDAFYTFIPPLIVDGALPKDGPDATYPLRLDPL